MALNALWRGRSAVLTGRVHELVKLLQPKALLSTSKRPHFGMHQRKRQNNVTLCSASGTVELNSSSADSPAANGDESFASLVDSQMAWPGRTHHCGSFREGDAGTAATICGWVDGYRNMGGVLFVDVRDHTGIVQVYSLAYHW